jgi:hypothetical protein
MTDCVRQGLTWNWRDAGDRPFSSGMDINARGGA